MKSIILIAALSFLVVPLFSLTTAIQQKDTEIFEGIFDGKEDYGYNFIGINDEDEQFTMTFDTVEATVLKSFDLDSEKLIGTTFIVTYSISTSAETDEDGFEFESETLNIIALKKVK